MVSSYPERKQDHILKYHPVNGRPLFADVSVMNRNGRDTKFEFYLNNNEVKDKNSEYVHSGASLCFHIATSENTGEGVKQLLLDKTNGEISELISLARIHDLWIHKGDEMSDAYALSHWFKKFHKANRDLIDEMKEFPDLSSAIFEQLLEKFNADTLAFKIKEAKEELESINEKLEALATSDAVKEVQFNRCHPDAARVCYVDSNEVWSLGISIVGSYMTRKKGWDVAIMNTVTDDEKHVYSLRSNDQGSNVDVAEICEEYKNAGLAISGGGHWNAAGVAFAKEKKDSFFTILDQEPTEIVSFKITKELYTVIEKLSVLKNTTFEDCVVEILDDAVYKELHYSDHVLTPDLYKQELGSGNCMQCAVAYLLRLPVEEVPDFTQADGVTECWDMFDDFFLLKDKMIVMYPPEKTSEAEYLASGTTSRGTSHMVVMRDGKLVFDPHPSNEGLTSIQCVWIPAPEPFK